MDKYYYQVLEDGEAIVRCVFENERGLEASYSDHSSLDETAADGDGSLCPPTWSDAAAWSECDREQAESMLKFSFRDEPPR